MRNKTLSFALPRAAISLVLLIVVVAFVLSHYSASKILESLQKLSLLNICTIFAALLANAAAAALRFKIIAAYTGHPLGFRRAMATVGAGSLGGSVFFQIAGQLIARGIIARRGGMPFAAVVVVTAWERIVAAIACGLLGIAGAWFIFGKVYLDPNTGGLELIKIMAGLVLAAIGGALIGYGPMAARSIAPFMTRHFVRRCLGIVGLTFLVQIPMMIAYVAAAHSLSAYVPIADLIAASAVVMFAASVPISLAGWGVREMSALIVLGAVGMSSFDALTAAVLIGAGSTLSMAFIAIVSLPVSIRVEPAKEGSFASSIDYTRALSWILPSTAAVSVLFQIYVPVRSGLLNVNLADPIALLAATIFILKFFKQRHLPQWRVSYFNSAVGIATTALGLGLLIGVARFGWTDWAWINRFLGWFVLLAYGATGALAVVEGGKDAFRIVLLTYVGAVVAITVLEICLLFFGIALPAEVAKTHEIEAFSQNHNFFAFQLLMALSAALVLLRGPILRVYVLIAIFAGLWFAGSRSGWLAAAAVLLASVYFGTATWRECIKALVGAAIVVFITFVTPFHLIASIPAPDVVPTGTSIHERFVTWLGGLKLFIAYPFFGAGLGAFRNEMIVSSSGIPLVIHSTALWLLAELGIVGFLAFAIPAFYVTATEVARARRVQAAAVSVLCIVAFAVMSGPADMVYQRTFWLLMGAALASS